MKEIKFRAWEKNLKEIIPVDNIDFEKRMINTGSAWRLFDEIELIQYTGLNDIDGNKIFDGDITEIDFGYGEVRRFVVKIKTVVREVVSHPSFSDETAKVAITGVVFEWKGFELFPCVDGNGDHDNESLMRVIGNIYENPKLLEGGQ
ncbi:hypothetical protein J1P26_17325 [Neobacillus sp. MM2021_6]|uniref:YopX family protein n=1 Tax=Bacillaceae TaxID=186817 RepID=UPI00140B6775|nr:MULTISPECIES: YopX family protein [Bacillaceae]MBO0961470.1 hypothetical protein [Neobacillus sp. MM2021_6]NHC19574.1 hypothetical protein [Bacillus sp. MM2020_4]